MSSKMSHSYPIRKFEGKMILEFACLVSEDLPEDPVVETEQVLDLGLREATLGGGDVAGHVAHKEMAVPLLELCIKSVSTTFLNLNVKTIMIFIR